jgi:hypothetical protein
LKIDNGELIIFFTYCPGFCNSIELHWRRTLVPINSAELFSISVINL